VQGTILERVAPDGTLYQLCPGCVIRLSGSGGTFQATGGANGAFIIQGVPEGTYKAERVCGLTTVPADGPKAVTVPTQSIDVLVPKCP
jgi:hypothetical protein